MTTHNAQKSKAQGTRKAVNSALFETIASLNGTEEIKDFLTDLCTPQELNAFQERWKIAQLLNGGDFSYREISTQTGASTTTVARVARFLNNEPHGGYRLVLEQENHRTAS